MRYSAGVYVGDIVIRLVQHHSVGVAGLSEPGFGEMVSVDVDKFLEHGLVEFRWRGENLAILYWKPDVAWSVSDLKTDKSINCNIRT